MGYYKHVARKQDRKEANKYLAKAKKLARDGDVSAKAKKAASYI